MKTYLEPEEVELLEKAATNLRDRLPIGTLSNITVFSFVQHVRE